ncbi:MAG: T9SS type A sorting domain-containing protein, partial [Flavobacterium sp.]
STRVAAVLATSTTNGIYGHSKAICDRLNNSTLEDVRTIQLNGYEIIMVKIKRANGAIEFALNFSVQQLASGKKLHSYWNINQYPSGDYLNFQVWGSSMGQVSSITNHILNQFQSQSTLTEDVVSDRIPTVFVKKGSYSNGNLYLKLINKTSASSISFSGNKKATELATSQAISQTIGLTGAYEQDLVINTGGIFDIGFSINGNNSPQIDALYMADGPWGIDYVTTETTIANYTIQNSTNTVAADEYSIERNVSVSGEVYGTANVFRNILPGELTFNATNYAAVSFSIQNSLPVEVILVTENTTDWNNRLRFQLPANATGADVTIAFSNFTNALGQTFANEKIKGFVFSTIGNYTSFQPFNIAVSNLKLGNNAALGNQDFENLVSTKMYNYPNPCQNNTTIVLPKITESAQVKIVDVFGKVIQNKKYSVDLNSINIDVSELSKGIYIFEVTTNENEKLQTKFIVK